MQSSLLCVRLSFIGQSSDHCWNYPSCFFFSNGIVNCREGAGREGFASVAPCLQKVGRARKEEWPGSLHSWLLKTGSYSWLCKLGNNIIR